MIERHVYLPARTRQPGRRPEPHSLGEGQIALNLADRRVFVGVAHEIDQSGVVEVADLAQLLEHWQRAIEHYTHPDRQQSPPRGHPDMQQPP